MYTCTVLELLLKHVDTILANLRDKILVRLRGLMATGAQWIPAFARGWAPFLEIFFGFC